MRIRAFFLPYIDQRSKIIGNESPMMMPEMIRTKLINLNLNNSIRIPEMKSMESTTIIWANSKPTLKASNGDKMERSLPNKLCK